MTPKVMNRAQQAERRRQGRHFFGFWLPPIIRNPRFVHQSRHLAALFLSAI